ncbi:hypothetical protein M422DRAFT_50520 [Sphaerobolus stellatus SS14]|uniref:Uncharacterized protein n=1 Tax=Sphaerobolus stellatus (strain SS14) TaxID=990650 RepID=A0A0C9V7E1_SPHS4|nr:hypothetical protein M422DRAFT_50520 [Sphaerobolus stellatus SS14]
MTRTHKRTQSASSTLQTPRSSGQYFPRTPPPATPLPPTPPQVRALHSRSQSSSGASGYSFGPIGNANQIDTLSAGLLPLLIPGLKVGSDVLVKDSPIVQRRTTTKSRSTKGRKTAATPPNIFDDEFGLSSSFNSPEIHSTPAAKRGRKGSRAKHMSLPSLGLGKDGVHSLTAWKEELVKVLGNFETKTPSGSTHTHHRRTVYGGETRVPTVHVQKTSTGSSLNPVEEDPSVASSQVEFGYAVTTSDDRRLSVKPFGETPLTSPSVYSDGFNTARSSMATMVERPPTSATALLPRSFMQQQQENFINAPSSSAASRPASPYHLPRGPAKRSSILPSSSNQRTVSALP